MKRITMTAGILMLALIGVASVGRAQGTVARGPDPSTLRDTDLEKDSYHNLEVAQQYFKLKKAYVASLKRSEEIIAGNPNFAKIDQALYIAGMSSFYLSQNRGKQKVESIPAKERLSGDQYREEARVHLSQLANDHPESSFSKLAADVLRELGGPLPKGQ